MRPDRQPQRVWSAAMAHTITGGDRHCHGVSGSGKTTVSALLAAALGCQFQEGDDLHPAENVEKMQGGTPLTDADGCPGYERSPKKSIAGARGAIPAC